MGKITTVAGNGKAAHAGDGGPALQAALHNPYTVSFDRAGAMYVTEASSNSVRKLAKDGTVTTIYGPKPNDPKEDVCAAYVWTDGVESLHLALRKSRQVLNLALADGAPAGSAIAGAWLAEPHDICPMPGGMRLAIADVKASKVHVFSTNTGMVAATHGPAPFRGARAVGVSPAGLLHVVEREGHCVRVQQPGWPIVAGTGKKGFSGDGGPATQAAFNGPKGICFDAAGNLFITDTENHAIRRIDAKTGVITTVAGTGKRGFSGDGGPGHLAMLDRPHGATVGPDGALYIGDSGNHRIRRVELD